MSVVTKSHIVSTFYRALWFLRQKYWCKMWKCIPKSCLACMSHMGRDEVCVFCTTAFNMSSALILHVPQRPTWSRVQENLTLVFPPSLRPPNMNIVSKSKPLKIPLTGKCLKKKWRERSEPEVLFCLWVAWLLTLELRIISAELSNQNHFIEYLFLSKTQIFK